MKTNQNHWGFETKFGNQRRPSEIEGNPSTISKIDDKLRKSLKNCDNLWKPMKIIVNQGRYFHNNEN